MPIRKDLRHFYRGPAWQAARAACRERAGDRCEQCGLANGDIGYRDLGGRFVLIAPREGELPAVDFPPLDQMDARLLLVQCGAAHLNNVAGDDRPDNLAWLCRGCHLKTDKPFHHATRSARKDSKRPLIAALEANV